MLVNTPDREFQEDRTLSSAADAINPAPQQDLVHYELDSRKGSFTAQAFATGVLATFGHSPTIAVRDFAGEAHFAVAGTSIENARLQVTIQAHSLEVTDDIREKDRREIHRQMYDEVLETDRFPEITYDCSRVSASGSGGSYWVALNGDLTLHGVTRPLPISARVVISGDTLRASGEFTVRQSDYDIAPVKVAAGALKLKDEVKITFDIVARRQP
jgi:polyisoprenoid-binding protein YceI